MSENHDPVVVEDATPESGGCPVAHGLTHPTQGAANRDWWPNQLNLKILRKHPAVANPMGGDFDYAAAFKTLDLDGRDAGHRGGDDDVAGLVAGRLRPLRPALHPDGVAQRGHLPHQRRSRRRRRGQQRFAPLNSWPDNGNLDKARRLLWPVKKKYGRKISWADLMIFAGNGALESMGFKTFGFAGGRADVWEPDEDVYWGPETTWLGDERYTGDRELENPLAAVQMGLIYVNPEGPNGNPGPARRGPRHPRDVPPDGDERRGDRRADRRRSHLRQDPRRGPATASAPSPRPPRSSSRASAGRTRFGTGKGRDAITSGIEVTWTPTPTTWDNSFFENLFGYEWELTKSPAGAHQWKPKDGAGADTVPDPEDPSKRRAPTMLTTDLSLRFDPVYEPISRRFLREPGRVRGRLRPGVVQADPPRHGPDRALPRPAGPVRDADLAGPRSRGGPRARRRRGHRRAQGADPRLGPVGVPARVDRVGVGLDVPRQRQARRRQRRAHPPRAAERLGGQRPRPAGDGAAHPRGDPAGLQRRPGWRQEGLARRPDRARRLRGGRAGRQERRPRRRGPVHAGPHRCVAGADRRGVVRRARADGGRVPQLPREGHPAAGRVPADRPGEPADPERSRDDGPRRRAARPGRELRRVVARRLHRHPRDADQRLLRQPARHGHDVAADVRGREDVRGPRRRHRRGQVDRQPGRPRLRVELRAARARGGLRQRRREGEVRAATSSRRGTR